MLGCLCLCGDHLGDDDDHFDGGFDHKDGGHGHHNGDHCDGRLISMLGCVISNIFVMIIITLVIAHCSWNDDQDKEPMIDTKII